jgi:hypothetical protein
MAYERRIGGAANAQREGNEFAVGFGPPIARLAGSSSFDKIAA